MKKSKILIVGLIGLLMAVGFVFAGCDIKKCPDGGDCMVYFRGNGVDKYVTVLSGSKSCSDKNCFATKMRTGTGSAGYESSAECYGCGD